MPIRATRAKNDRDRLPHVAVIVAPPGHLTAVSRALLTVGSTNSRTQPGTGIGLALVKELVDIQHGRVTVESTEAETTFSVTLPRVTFDLDRP